MNPHIPERRMHLRISTSAHFMMKLGMDRGCLSGYGTIVEISQGGFLLATDLLPENTSAVCKNMGRCPLLLFGTEHRNRHFSILAYIQRITEKDQLACTIGATTSDDFLHEWIEDGIK